MKNLWKNHILVLGLLALEVTAHGQDVIRQVACYDSTLKKEADSLKASFYKQGFVVVREAAMMMESE